MFVSPVVDVGEVFEIPEFDVSDVPDVFDVPEVYPEMLMRCCIYVMLSIFNYQLINYQIPILIIIYIYVICCNDVKYA